MLSTNSLTSAPPHGLEYISIYRQQRPWHGFKSRKHLLVQLRSMCGTQQEDNPVYNMCTGHHTRLVFADFITEYCPQPVQQVLTWKPMQPLRRGQGNKIAYVDRLLNDTRASDQRRATFKRPCFQSRDLIVVLSLSCWLWFWHCVTCTAVLNII